MKVRCPSGSNRFKTKYTAKTVKHPAWVMVSGCFHAKLGNVTLNSECYKKVLEDHHLPSMIIHRSEFFLQDWDMCQASKKIKALIRPTTSKPLTGLAIHITKT
jgi:hypothetical protein